MRLLLRSFLLLSAVSLASSTDQMPMDDTYVPETFGRPTLADLLTIDNSASIFYSYARELELSRGLSDNNLKMTLFVPTNKAVMALARKPHQGNAPVEDHIEISEQEYDRLSRSNVERWVSSHIIPDAPITLEGTQQTLLPAKLIVFNSIAKSSQGPEWSRISLENGIRITQKTEASNGDLYMIDGAISSGLD